MNPIIADYLHAHLIIECREYLQLHFGRRLFSFDFHEGRGRISDVYPVSGFYLILRDRDDFTDIFIGFDIVTVRQWMIMQFGIVL